MPATHRSQFPEGLDAYPDIVTTVSAYPGQQRRLIRSGDTAPTTQWILQRRKRPDVWFSMKFMQSKVGLDIYVLPDCTPSERAIVSALPDWCPQRG